MKLAIHHPLPIITTCLCLVASVIGYRYWVPVPALLIASGVWYWQMRKLACQLNVHQSLVKRVEELKALSLDLEAVVNKELALVQDDVLRIRSIVSDSIELLQANVEGVSDQSARQYHCIKPLIKNEIDDVQVVDLEVKTIIDKLIDQLTIAANAIAQTEAAARETALLANDILVDSAYLGHSAGSVAQPASEIRTMVDTLSTTDMSHHSAIVQRSINDLQQFQQNYTADASAQPVFEGIKRDVEDTQFHINESSKNIIRALQFEDIVSQISERVVNHISDIRSTAAILSHLCESELSDNFAAEIVDMRTTLNSLKEKLEFASAKAVVAQQSMEEGDIELF